MAKQTESQREEDRQTEPETERIMFYHVLSKLVYTILNSNRG